MNRYPTTKHSTYFYEFAGLGPWLRYFEGSENCSVCVAEDRYRE